jgi:F0F1-type ATP synthase membrane subunit a
LLLLVYVKHSLLLFFLCLFIFLFFQNGHEIGFAQLSYSPLVRSAMAQATSSSTTTTAAAATVLCFV